MEKKKVKFRDRPRTHFLLNAWARVNETLMFSVHPLKLPLQLFVEIVLEALRKYNEFGLLPNVNFS